MASTSPPDRENDTSRTAWTSPAAVSKLTDRFFTSNNAAIEDSPSVYFVMVHSVTFQKMPTPWWPMTVSGEMPARPSTAT